MSGESVKVIVRCRPINKRESDLKCQTVVGMIQGVTCHLTSGDEPNGPPKSFTFDGAYDVDSTTEQIYNDVGFPLVESVLEGYNGTVFAYGQTGCGKSFTMQGIVDPPSQRGIIPRSFEHIFEVIQTSEDMKFLVHASYLEIYNEEIRDLLGTDTKKKLDLKEHPERGVYVAGLTQHSVHNTSECEGLMEKGWSSRSVGSTLMNAESSRSHSIFTIALEMMSTAGDSDVIRSGKLNLVDLAGSERQAKTGATGDRLKEATKINLSLSALGNVISALVDGKSKHIPYRDSKLTRLLQDSLGGNTKTLMVACLSPADNNYDESLSTLRYANRAKNIKNKPKINEDPKDAMLREYQEEIRKLRDMLDKQGPVETVVSVAPDENALEKEREKVRKEYEAKMKKMKKDMEAERESKAELQANMDDIKKKYEDELQTVNKRIQEQKKLLAQQEQQKQQKLIQQQQLKQQLQQPKQEQRQQSAFIQDQNKKTIGIETVTEDGTIVYEDIDDVARSNTPTVGVAKMQNAGMMTSLQEEALKRLRELQKEMIGGEKAQDKELKAKRMKRKKYLEKRKKILSDALKNVDDEDGIMIKVYDDIHEELRAKTDLAKKQKQRIKSLEQEIRDLSEEFQSERSDYLETIRKQDQQVKLLQAVLEKVQPTIRRDCNYSDIDSIKKEAYWDEEYLRWKVPDLTVVKTKLPPAAAGEGRSGRQLEKYGSAISAAKRLTLKSAKHIMRVSCPPLSAAGSSSTQAQPDLLTKFNQINSINNNSSTTNSNNNMKTTTDNQSVPDRLQGRNTSLTAPARFSMWDEEEEDDRILKQKLQRAEQEDIAGSYFKPKRAKELLVKFKGEANGLPQRKKRNSNANNLNASMSQNVLGNALNLNSSFNNSSFNNSSFNNSQGPLYASTWGSTSTGSLNSQSNMMSTYGGSGGALNNLGNVMSNGWLGDNGYSNISPETSMRRPNRLEALPSVNQRNTNRKKSRDVLHTLDLI